MSKLISNPAKTSLTIVAGFLLIYIISGLSWTWCLYIASIVAILSILSSKVARLIEQGWFLLTKLLSFIVPNIILSAIFYLFLFPISLIYRLTGSSDPLMLKSGYDTTFKRVDKTFTSDSFKNPW